MIKLLFIDIMDSLVDTHVGIHLTKTTAAQNDVALTYHRMRGLYFLAVIFVRSIVLSYQHKLTKMRANLDNLNHCAVRFFKPRIRQFRLVLC